MPPTASRAWARAFIAKDNGALGCVGAWHCHMHLPLLGNQCAMCSKQMQTFQRAPARVREQRASEQRASGVWADVILEFGRTSAKASAAWLAVGLSLIESAAWFVVGALR